MTRLWSAAARRRSPRAKLASRAPAGSLLPVPGADEATTSSHNRPASKFIDPAAFTPFFTRRRGELHCESVPAAAIAKHYGTPAYVYSSAAIRAAFRALDSAFARWPHTLCYSVKANSNLSILRLLARLGSGFDIVSGGELYRLRRAGVSPRRVVFSGVGKTRDEIRDALRAGILLFNVESAAELEMLAQEASRLRRPAPAGVRVNPDVAAGGHPHISTGRRHHKFGVDWDEARRLYRAWKDSRWIRWQGISAHIGSQILSVAPFRRAAQRLSRFVQELSRDGIRLKYFDFGGGLGIRYTGERPLPQREYARALIAALRPTGCHLLLEPGRSIVGAAGVLLTRVILTKRTGGKRFIVTDAAMNDLMRPALYDAVHPITKAKLELRNSKVENRKTKTGAPPHTAKLVVGDPSQADFRFSFFDLRADIVGPVCETGDCFLHDWPIEEVNAGDLLVIWGAGAYGFAIANNYNSRPRPAEVLVEGSRTRLIRRRESHADLIRGE
ncbi:MAG: diaminopimelate decarboxylase [Candidatus Acidiferrales bacterium]